MAIAISDMDTPIDAVLRQIDREVELVRSAIRLVASGASSATTIAGISFGELAIGLLSAEASAAGETMEPIWRTDDAGCDVRVSATSPAFSPPAR